jgi:hypothetical protein
MLLKTRKLDTSEQKRSLTPNFWSNEPVFLMLYRKKMNLLVG